MTEPVSELRVKIVDAVRAKLNFDSYELDPTTLGLEGLKVLESLPAYLERMWVKPYPHIKGSVFSGMKELCVVGGFMQGESKEVKVLVIYLERPVSSDGVFDFGLVSINQLLRMKKEAS